MKTVALTRAGLMIAVVFVITRVLVLPIPQTKGFFNLGEAGIYAAAVLFGPVVGALAGGLGSALADLSLGYTQYAPFTLVIKGLEGWLVGAIAQGGQPGLGRVGLIVCALGALWAFTVDAWLVRVAAVVLLLAALGGLGWSRFRQPAAVGIRLAAMLAGGVVMVAGYFVTQAYLLGLGQPAALAEVPYNLVQVAVGVVAGVAVAAGMERAIPRPA